MCPTPIITDSADLQPYSLEKAEDLQISTKLPVIQALDSTLMLQAQSWFLCQTCRCGNKNSPLFRLYIPHRRCKHTAGSYVRLAIANVTTKTSALLRFYIPRSCYKLVFMLDLQTLEQKLPFTKVLHSTLTPQAQSCFLHSFL